MVHGLLKSCYWNHICGDEREIAGVLFERFLHDKEVMEQDLSGLWGKAESYGGSAGFHRDSLILRVSDCQEELRDFGENFVQIGVFLAFSHSLSPSCSFSFPSLLGMWYSHTQLTHCLVSIPFYSCINLLLLPARNVLS